MDQGFDTLSSCAFCVYVDVTGADGTLALRTFPFIIIEATRGSQQTSQEQPSLAPGLGGDTCAKAHHVP